MKTLYQKVILFRSFLAIQLCACCRDVTKTFLSVLRSVMASSMFRREVPTEFGDFVELDSRGIVFGHLTVNAFTKHIDT